MTDTDESAESTEAVAAAASPTTPQDPDPPESAATALTELSSAGLTEPPSTGLTEPSSAGLTEPSSAEVADGAGEVTPPTGDAAPVPSRGQRRRRRITEWVVLIVVVVLVSVGIRTFALQAFFVPSGSMIPALLPGDRILVDKLFFHPSSLHRGDIVVFAHPPNEHCGAVVDDLVKRVIGLPGQTIWSVGNTIYIANGSGSGAAIKEPYLPPNDPLGSVAITRQKIRADNYFVMGDNRAISCDSRYWGPVPGNLIVGKVVLTWWRNGHPDFKTF